MAEENVNIEENLTGLDKLQKSYEEHANTINIVVIAALLIIVAALAYFKWYKPKQEIAAQETLFEGQFYFEIDSFQKALDNGILTTADSYGGTKAGNLAKYYAGIAYYNLGNYPEAISYLKKFCPDHDDVVGGIGINALADAQMENGDTEAGLKSYKKAAMFSTNEATAPLLLFKAGLAHETNGKLEEAKKMYQTIADKYPNSEQARDIKKYLGRIEAKM